MSLLFDTHAHLADPAFADDLDDVLARTMQTCGGVMTIGCEGLTDFDANIALAESHPRLFTAVSLHPSNAPDDSPEVRERIRTLMCHPKVRAVGETGLDYHWMTSPKETQIELFAWHIQLAREVKKPLLVHDREAHRDTLDTLWANGAEEVGGVLHAYSGSVEMLDEILAHHFYIGLGGVVTFKNAKHAKAVAQAVPLDRLLLETDCPYLTPTPFRGQRNEPSYTRYVAETIAELRGIRYEEVVEATWENACRFYDIQL